MTTSTSDRRFDARIALELSGCSVGAMAERISVSRGTLHRWIRTGANEWQADVLAVKGVGVHPTLIWPTWFHGVDLEEAA